MTRKELESKTNEGGRKFVPWIYMNDVNKESEVEILGTTKRGARKGEFFVIYRRGQDVRVAVLSERGEKNDGSCFYGSISQYCTELQRDAAVARGERYPGRYCPKTAKEITEWIMSEFGVPREAFWYK